MEKKRHYRETKRNNGLGTTDAIWKVLNTIFWAKKESRTYKISVLCEQNQLGHLNCSLVEGLYDWQDCPTREHAELLRDRMRNYADENWDSRKQPKKAESQPEQQPQEDVLFPDTECFEIVRDGVRYAVTMTRLS